MLKIYKEQCEGDKSRINQHESYMLFMEKIFIHA